mmetsp:Transcript_14907/g.36291  ORF Transcript_14907/g.36291 Transcript_14907/m.36291 type:complete len:81 (-) Transcript_14907:501-743(-)
MMLPCPQCRCDCSPIGAYSGRGIGEGATGTSLSLVSPAEDKSHSEIIEALKVSFSKVMLDGRLMTDASKIFIWLRSLNRR